MQAKNVCHDNFMFQNDDTSSIENNSPPTGAPKAEATPAAAPAEMKLRLFEKWGTNNQYNNGVDTFHHSHLRDRRKWLL